MIAAPSSRSGSGCAALPATPTACAATASHTRGSGCKWLPSTSPSGARTSLPSRLRELRAWPRQRNGVAEAKARLDERPEKIVEKYINEADIAAARAEAARAFRSREYSWEALSALGLLHAELPEGGCRCGKRRRENCPEAALVEGVVGLRAWEARQAQEYRAGRRHFLPDGHPSLIDHTWRGEEPEEWAG